MRTMRIMRVYRKYQEWEEIEHNMWGEVENKKGMLAKAIAFTGDHERYGSFMQRVVNEWPVSCENALTDKTLNRKAWIGHAAAALALKCPENITRAAWRQLTYEQQLLANEEARRAISMWEHNYRKVKNVYKNMGNKMLFGWDS